MGISVRKYSAVVDISLPTIYSRIKEGSIQTVDGVLPVRIAPVHLIEKAAELEQIADELRRLARA